MKKVQLDESNALLLISPHGQRLSMIHHVPEDGSLPAFEDLTVRIPGGATEEIIIHTDFAPPTPRLSLDPEQSTLTPVSCALSYIEMIRNSSFLSLSA